MTARPPWREWFLDGAQWASRRGECTRSKVGALVVKDNRVIATGYNGAEAGAPSCLDGACPRGRRTYDEVPALSDYTGGVGKCIATHAEANAIYDAQNRGLDPRGAVVYITRAPCPDCAELIESVGATAAWEGS